MSIILYTNDCPKCKILKTKLNEKGVQYEVFDNVDEMIKKGFTTMPILEVDGEKLNFLQANNFIKEMA